MLLIDAHVHIYDCFDLEKFFDSAYENFKTEAEKQGHADDFTGVLLLAETSNDNWFQRLSGFADGKSLPENKTTGAWKFNRTDELESLHARSVDNRELILIAGRQIVTAENLELLALATMVSFEDGKPLNELIQLVLEKNGIPVIPWGFGKWTGQRGAILSGMIETAQNSDFYLGDNGNRSFFLSYPSQFALAQTKNVTNLPGSDPLPFSTEFNRAGCFGISLPDELSSTKPAEDLKEKLKKRRKALNYYGALERPYRFFRNQIASQVRKRIRG